MLKLTIAISLILASKAHFRSPLSFIKEEDVLASLKDAYTPKEMTFDQVIDHTNANGW